MWKKALQAYKNMLRRPVSNHELFCLQGCPSVPPEISPMPMLFDFSKSQFSHEQKMTKIITSLKNYHKIKEMGHKEGAQQMVTIIIALIFKKEYSIL